jgi:hypothetical protein
VIQPFWLEGREPTALAKRSFSSHRPVRRQIRSAERIIELTRHGRVKLRCYEQNIEIDG